MAYCQAQLYARYMLKRFGEDALIKMLMAYRRGRTTDRAIDECFHVDKADFEKGYLSYLDEVVKTIRTRVSEEQPVKFSQLERKLKEKPDDPELNAKMAYEHFARRNYAEARPFADKALAQKPHHPLASYVKARLMQSIGDDDAALAILEPALDPKRPNERVIDLLAELKMKAGQLDQAAELYELARKDDPAHTKWIAGLARVHLRQKDTERFLSDLAMIATNDADDITVRKALAERHLAQGQAGAAEKWANECLYIDVYDPSVHVLLADAQAAGRKFAEAIKEYQTALELKAKKPNDLKVRLARAQLGRGDRGAAKATVEAVLKEDPEHPEAKALRDEIERAKLG
jgi:tetratricopeptide (TPR) repeat protein